MAESIQYEVTKADCVAAARFRLRLARGLPHAWMAALLPFTVLAVVASYKRDWIEALLLAWVIVVGLVLLPILYVMQLIAVSFLARRGFAGAERLGRDVVLTWDESGFRMLRAGETLACRWQDVRKIGEHRRLLLLHLRRHGVRLVPKAAFGSDTELKNFQAHAPSDNKGNGAAPWFSVMRTGLTVSVCFLVLSVFFLAGLALTIDGVDLPAAPTYEEATRVISPSGRLDAVLYKTNGGWSKGLGYEVWLSPHGMSGLLPRVQQERRPAFLYWKVRNDRGYGANLHWESADVLAVEYLKADHVEQNLSEVQVGDETVRIVLRPGVEDPSAPGGGMLREAPSASSPPPTLE